MGKARKALSAGARPRFFLASAHGRTELLAIEEGDVLVVRTLHPPVQFKTAWGKLTLADRRSLALALLREGTAADHALIAFYALATGDRATADAHLPKAGAAGEALRKAFE
jgi:hypothetical protein